MKTLIFATIDPSALPALRIGGLLFLIINLIAGAYLIRHWRSLFGPDSSVDGDIQAVRQLRLIVFVFPWAILTMRLLIVWVELWIK